MLAIAACGGPASSDAPPPKEEPQGLAAIDPCALLTPEELKSFGFEESGEPDSSTSSEPGCRFNGRPFRATFSKNQEKTVESYGKQDNWAKFDRAEVDGRPAASAIDKSATQARICSALFNAGGGVIIIDVSEFRDQGLDECAEGLKIAEAIAPRMPR
ncbi:DUF3558 domain-containing protein [Saccharopolyspora shandongensis]|uniref:DUF3558 domain-containing protein n=1 Tax=Saccharopolyspora shandongensis TaxID=418495 RepID=UPI000B85FAE8|nr:DUF3558 domain-containing protein [Saccharopolyspora shandongensis]